MRIVVVSASARSGSQSLKISKYIAERLTVQETGSDLLDLYELPLPLYDDAQHPELVDMLTSLKQRLDQADGFVFVSPEWNGMASVALFNMFHYLDHELAHKPVMMVGVSSGRGGAYLMQQMRIMGPKNMHYVISPENIIVSHCKDMLNDQNFNDDAPDIYLKKRTDYALRVLTEYAQALQTVRTGGTIDFDTYATGM